MVFGRSILHINMNFHFFFIDSDPGQKSGLRDKSPEQTKDN